MILEPILLPTKFLKLVMIDPIMKVIEIMS